MKKEGFVSTLVMTVVTILMLVGVTIAWYTAVLAKPTVTGMQMEAEETGGIKVALESGGVDITELSGDDRYVTIGLEKLLNIENEQMAPGAYGEVVFYISSLSKNVAGCQVVPSLVPGYEEAFLQNYPDGIPADATVTINNTEKNVSTVLEEHFDFYANAEMTQEVNGENPLNVPLEWDAQNSVGIEKTVTIYWKWHYEDPDAQKMAEGAEKELAIYDYDMEDTWLGTHLDTMSFHFDFLIQ